LENENKKIEAEFVVSEESDYKQETQDIEELKFGDLNNRVNTVVSVYKDTFLGENLVKTYAF
jgi:hypothetical protein